MIRLASEQDLPAIAAIYEAILDHEDATGLHYTGWQRGAYPTLDTAKGGAADKLGLKPDGKPEQGYDTFTILPGR